MGLLYFSIHSSVCMYKECAALLKINVVHYGDDVLLYLYCVYVIKGVLFPLGWLLEFQEVHSPWRCI